MCQDDVNDDGNMCLFLTAFFFDKQTCHWEHIMQEVSFVTRRVEQGHNVGFTG